MSPDEPQDNGDDSSLPDDALVPADEILHNIFEEIESRRSLGVETGFDELDLLLGGLRGGELIVIGSRPGHGKTSLITAIAANTSVKKNLPLVIFNLESNRWQFCKRLICYLSGIELHKFNRSMLNSNEYARLAECVGAVAKAPLRITAPPRISIDGLCSMSRTAVRNHGAKLILIDYIQRIMAPGDNRTEQLTLISSSLKSITIELGIPVICASELNRGMFEPNDPRPRGKDLRGSGTLRKTQTR